MRRFAVLLLTVFPLLSAPPVKTTPSKAKKPALTEESTPQAWPIESISIEGNHLYKPERVIAATGLKIGQTAGKPEFEAARDRLIATGAFSSVGYKFEPAKGKPGYAASFQVVEIEQVYPYRFEGIPADNKVIADALHRSEPLYTNVIPGTQEVIDRVTREVEEELGKIGKAEKVKGKLSAETDGKMMIVFRPARLAAVAEVYFVGGREIDPHVLQSNIAGVAIGSLYTPENMRQLLDNSIRPLYEERGKLKVAFPKFATGPASKVDGVAVTVTVDEGPTFKLGDVSLEGAVPDGEEGKLLKEGDFKKDEVANFTQIKAGVDRIEKRLRREGYMRVATKLDRHLNDKTSTVDLVLHVEPGPQFKFGILTINGLDVITEPQIRKMWALKGGAPYNADYPYYFLRRLEEGNYFENLGKTATALHVDDETQQVDVTLMFNSNGKPLPAIGPAREQLERQRRAEKKSQDIGMPPQP